MIPSPLLLADRSVCLRRLVLRDLFPREDTQAELAELEPLVETDPLVTGMAALQSPDGSWNARDLGASWGAGGDVLATGYGLACLGACGLDQNYLPVRKAVDYLRSVQLSDGSWAMGAYNPEVERSGLEGGGYAMVPLQTAIPLRGLAAVGAAQEPFCEAAYEWLLRQRLEGGAWPTGLTLSGVHGYVAGYRRLAHSRWGCRSNTTGALVCLSLHPTRRTSEAARRALDLLLGRETSESGPIGFDTARTFGMEPVRGFFTYYRVYDLALILNLCWRLAVSLEDERVRKILSFVLEKRNAFGLWDYPDHPQAARWISYDLTRSFQQLSNQAGWVGSEPRTPFQSYPKQRRRF